MSESPTPESGRSRESVRAAATGDVGVALAIVGVGVVLLTGIPAISVGAGYDRIGPRFFPFLVAIGSLLVGVWILMIRTATDTRDPLSWRPLAALALAFVASVALIERAGFVIAASLQFWLVTRAFESRRPARDAVVAALLALAVYFLFSRGLGLRLPAGVFESLR